MWEREVPSSARKNRTCILPFPAPPVVLVHAGGEGTLTLEPLFCRGIQVGICTCQPFPPCSRSSRKSAGHHVSYRALQPPPHLPGRSVIGMKGDTVRWGYSRSNGPRAWTLCPRISPHPPPGPALPPHRGC